MTDKIVDHNNRCIAKERNDFNYLRERDSKDTTKAEVKALVGALFTTRIKKEIHNHTAVYQLHQSDGMSMILLQVFLFSTTFLTI